MAFVVSDFRKAYPEFNDLGKYPDGLITGWATVATAMVNSCFWRSMTALGINLYVAHEITLEVQSQAAANVGGTPGGQSGPVNSKMVGSVTVSYDTAQAVEKDAGHWGLTVYGKQFLRLARTFGAGGIQL
jgi:hypothetical protein